MIAQARKDRQAIKNGAPFDRVYWLPNLEQSRMVGRQYYLGSEIMGVIYRAFGRKRVFEVYENPGLAFKSFNEGVRKLKLGDEFLL